MISLLNLQGKVPVKPFEANNIKTAKAGYLAVVGSRYDLIAATVAMECTIGSGDKTVNLSVGDTVYVHPETSYKAEAKNVFVANGVEFTCVQSTDVFAYTRA